MLAAGLLVQRTVWLCSSAIITAFAAAATFMSVSAFDNLWLQSCC
jgi:hypothetical protein